MTSIGICEKNATSYLPEREGSETAFSTQELNESRLARTPFPSEDQRKENYKTIRTIMHYKSL